MHKLLCLFLFQAIISLLVPIPALSGTEVTNPQNVLVVHTGGPTVPWFRALHPIFEKAIQERTDKRILFNAEFLDLYKRNDETYRTQIIDLLRTKYTDTQFDLLVTFGPHALDLMLDHKAALFPSVPLVFGRAQPVVPEKAKPFSDVTGVILKPGISRVESTLGLGLALHPGTSRVIVVLGTDGWSRKKEAWAKERFKKFEGQLEFIWTSDKSMDEILTLVESLPQHSLVLYLFLAKDAKGNIFVPTEACRIIAESSSAPVYATFDTLIGTGIVGGHMSRARTHAYAVADIGAKILNGHDPKGLPVQSHGFEYVFDWRQIDKWGINESAIPANSVLHFKTVSLWEQYKNQLLLGVFVIGVQFFLIGGLILNRHKVVQAKQTASESEARFRSMIDASPVSIMAIRDGRFLSVNPSGCRMLGYSAPDELIGTPALNVVASESRATITERLRRLEKGQSNPFAEATLVRKDGTTFTIESTSVSVPIDDKTTAMVFAQDISHRKEIETRLKESEERFRAFMNHIPASIYIKDQDDKHIYGNPAAIKSVNRNAGDFIGKTTRDFFPSKIAERLIELDRRILNENSPMITEEWSSSEGGDTFWRKDIKFPIKLSSGRKVLGGVAIDISDLKQTQMALAEQLEFELLIADIAARLTQTDYDKLGENIDAVLLSLCQALHTERSFLAQCSQDGQTLRHTNICTIEDFSVPTHWYELEIAGDFPWIMQQLQNGLVINTGPGLTGLPDEASELRGWLEDQAIQSGLVVPVRVEGTVVGMLGLEYLRQPREFPSSIVDRLKIVADMIGTALHRHRAEKKIDEQLRFEDLISRLSATFIHIKASEIDDTIERGLGLVASFLNVQRGNLFMFSKANKELRLIYSYTAAGVEKTPEIVYSDKLPWFTNRLLSEIPYYFSTLAELPLEAAAEKVYLKQAGVKSAVVIPLMAAGVSHGGITLSSLTVERHWSDKLIQQLKTVADVFANALMRKRAHGIIEQRLAVESLLANLATGFINLAVDEMDRYLEVAMGNISELFSMDRASILQFNPDLSELYRTHMWQRDGINPDPHGLPLQVHDQFPEIFDRLKKAETIIISNTENLPDDVAAYCQAIGIQSFIMLPLVVGSRNLGTIVFSTIFSKATFRDAQVKQLGLFSTIVANAIARQITARSLTESREQTRLLAGRMLTIQESERRRLARELHDDLSQRLAVLAMSCSRIRENLKSVSAETADSVHSMHRQLVKISEDVHAISRQLHPSILEDLGLIDAVRNEINAFRRREGIDVNYLSSELPQKLPKDISLCFFRIIQESLRNIARHARTDSASITLTVLTDHLDMEIRDHGCGFDQENNREQLGLGLISMGERVRMINGKLDITSAPGQGTRIRVSAPITAEGER